MNKRKIGWILALSMLFSQNMGIWAENLPDEVIHDAQTASFSVQGSNQEYELRKIEEASTDRFIVKYKTQTLRSGDKGLSKTELTKVATQAFAKASQAKELKIECITENQQISAVESALAEQQATEQASITAVEWKPGYLLFDLGETVDTDTFIAEMESQPDVEYIQPDYQLEFASTDELSLELEIVGEQPVQPETTEELVADNDLDEPVVEEMPVPEIAPESTEESESSAELEKTMESEAAITSEETVETEVANTSEETTEPTQTPEVTEQEVGAAVVVAVIDGGVDITHEVFENRIVDAWDFVQDTSLTYDSTISDQYYHGTHVAGIIAQTAPDAKLMPLKVFEQGRAYTSDIIDAIDYAEEHGATIVNCSWGSTDHNLLLKEAMEDSNMLFICAAGNNRVNLEETPIYPASFDMDNILSVTSVNADSGLTYFSNYGDVEIAAVGRDVNSALPDDQYGEMSGTSMSAAVVSGAAAMVDDGQMDIKARLLNTADRYTHLLNYVDGGRMLNIQNAIEDIQNTAVQEQDYEEDFDQEGYDRTPEENWELFNNLGNKQVAAGADFMAVLKENGTVWTWGNNSSGQLGDGTVEPCGAPKQVVEIDNVNMIAVGDYTMFAIKEDGSVWAWGSNSGQFGDGTTTKRTIPIKIFEGGIKDITAGYAHAMFIKEDGSLWASGTNSDGQLGDGTTTNRLTPIEIMESGVKTAAAGDYNTLAVKEDGSLWSWGYNYYAQVGDGTNTNRLLPIQIIESGVKAVDAAQCRSAAIKEDGSLWAWGYKIGGRDDVADMTREPIEIIGNGVKTIAVSSNHTLAIKEDDSLWAWGSNNSGQLGDGTTIDRITPVQIMANGVEAISTRSGHTIALKNDGSIWTWGVNTFGGLGDGTTIRSTTPKEVLHSSVSVMVAGYERSAIIKEDGSLWMYGDNRDGKLGDGSTQNKSTPTQIISSGVKAVEIGYSHSVALKEDGSVWTWGKNNLGQLGDGTSTAKTTPTQIIASGVKAIAVGKDHTLAIKEDGSLWAWGST